MSYVTWYIEIDIERTCRLLYFWWFDPYSICTHSIQIITLYKP